MASNKDYDEIMAESFVRFGRHLPKVHDRTLIVLKGHLLLEAEINGLLEDVLPDPAPVVDGPFSFAQRLAVLRAMLGEDEYQHLDLPAVETLNKLRNKLAHHLEHDRIESLVGEFLRAALPPEYQEVVARDGECEGLRYAVTRLGAMMAGRRAGRRLSGGRPRRAPEKPE